MQKGRKVLKITVSEKNILITTRTNNYQKADYEKGFSTALSNVKRNESSPFTYHKTLNYGDCIMEKRHAKEMGIQEPIFLNTKGEIAEGATTNVFFYKRQSDNSASSILRNASRYHERIPLFYIFNKRTNYPAGRYLESFDEMFLTNSLLGIMPVAKLGSHIFPSMNTGKKLLQELYNSQCSFC